MAYTVTAGIGSNVLVGTNPTPAYPVNGMGAGRLAFLQLGVKNDLDGTLTPPAGWTQVGTAATGGAYIQSLYQRTLDGTETPGSTITVTSTGTATGSRRCAWIVVVNAPGSGWNFEDVDTSTSPNTSTITDNGVTSSGTGRLAMNFIGYSNMQTGGQENFTGETGGSWIAQAYFQSGNSPTMSLQTCEIGATTINGGQDTSVTPSAAWVIHGLAIWRSAAVQPDLTVTDITWDVAAPAVGKPLLFSAVIANTGAGASPQGVPHGVRFTYNGVNAAFSTSWTDSLPATSGTATVYADSVWVPTANGTHDVVATVDYSGLIAESNEANNDRTESLTVIDLPDLVVTDITYTPASPVVGDNVVFSAVVNNVGAGASPAVMHKVKFEVGGSQVAVSTSHVTSIAASGNATIAADAGWVPGSPGTFAVVATIDPDGSIDEFDDSNNNYSENVTVAAAGAGTITSFAGRGPNASGEIWPLLGDYDEFFLTQGEADELYLQSIPAEFLTQTAGDARYLQEIPSEYITQSEADAQGMPSIEAGSVTQTTLPIREVNANFSLLAATSPSLYWQSYFNISNAAVTVSNPIGGGYQAIQGSTSIPANTSALFVKRAGVSQFRRWS